MKDDRKSREKLIGEVKSLRRRVEELEKTATLERTQAEEELKSSDNKYLVILNDMDEAYFELDLAGNITFFNKSTREMLGYEPETIMGMNYRSYVSPDTALELFKIYNKIYRTGEPAETFSYPILRKDGTKRYREVSASLRRDLDGRPIGFRCLARDVTKRKLAEEELKRKDEELEIKSRSLLESNTALKVLLKQREEDRVELERNLLSNVREIVMPYIEELKKSGLNSNQAANIATIEANLANIISPFLRNLTLKHFNLTAREFKVANLVKEGRTSKEISDMLNISEGAVNFHRNNIRKKLGLNTRKTNLRSYLLSLT
jgi:PAS domain S-box-containing protein